MENTEKENSKIQVSLRMDPAVFGAVADLATREDRSLTNMIERLLKQSPPIQQILESETAAGVNA